MSVKSLKYFTFDCDDFYSIQKEASSRENREPDFLQRKIKAAIWLRATFTLVIDGVEKDFLPASLNALEVQSMHRVKLLELMTEERRILMARVTSHLARFQSAILNASNDEQLSKTILLLRKKVVVGIYSPVEKEILKSRGTY
jgi:hypothetical protein